MANVQFEMKMQDVDLLNRGNCVSCQAFRCVRTSSDVSTVASEVS